MYATYKHSAFRNIDYVFLRSEWGNLERTQLPSNTDFQIFRFTELHVSF